MTQTSHPSRTPDAGHRSAVARVTVVVAVDDGTETVTYERRLPDAVAARTWCEDKVQCCVDGTTVLEIQVTEEVWGQRHAWEAIASRHTPETLQLGLRSPEGSVSWAVPRAIGRTRGLRRP